MNAPAQPEPAPSAPAPRVSVVMPLFNARPYLAETIASLRAQAWPDLELLVIDDGSTDGSFEAMAELCPEAVLWRQANQGPSVARNAGIARATGKYLTFLDADDLWPEGKLARQVARLEAEPELEATLGYIRLFTDEASAAGGGAGGGALTRAWGRPFFLFLLGGMVCRRELMLPGGVGGFDAERFPFRGEDTDWFFRAWESGRKMEIREEAELHYRRRPGSLTENSDDTKRSFPGLVMTSLRRRRGPDGRTRPLPDSLRLPKHIATR
jgi:glycosyltransferase involved in cell wall biosynthesis